jgi:hypothetical protein
MSTSVGNLSVELGISDDQLRAGLAQAVVQAQQAGQKMQAAIGQATKMPTGGGGGFGGMGGFAQTIGRIADDAQYGFRGIVNNLEQLGQTAGSTFGLSAKDAMAFGAVMTLLGVAVNQAADELVKLTDTRSEFEKLTTSAVGYAGALNMAEAAMKSLASETSDLMKKDSTSGIGAFFGRISGKMTDNASEGKGVFSDLFGGRTPKAQLEANKVAGEQAHRNQMDMMLTNPKVQRDRAAMEAGAGLVERGRNAKDTEINKDAGVVMKESIKGKEELSRIQVERQMIAGGMKPMDAETESLKLLGNASNGVVEAFNALAARLPELKLAENLQNVNNARDTESNMKNLADDFRDREKVKKKKGDMEDKIGDARDRLEQLTAQRARTEIVGSSDVFNRNLNAGTGDDPTVKAIEKQTEEIRRMTDEIKGLG